MRHDDEGREILNNTPVAIPARLTARETETERFRSFLRSEEMARRAAAQGFETEEEANDFDIGEDFEPLSPHEMLEDVDGVFLNELQPEYPVEDGEAVAEQEAQPTLAEQMDIEDVPQNSDAST